MLHLQKIYILCSVLLCTLSGYAGKIKVNTNYDIVTLPGNDEPVALVESILMKFKNNDVFIGKTDDTYWNWSK